MKVLGWEKVEDCFDESSVFDCRLSKTVDEQFLDSLRQIGQLLVFRQASPVMFKFDKPGCCSIKGVIGTSVLRVTFTGEEFGKKEFESLWA